MGRRQVTFLAKLIIAVFIFANFFNPIAAEGNQIKKTNVYSIAGSPNDEYYARQWYLKSINAEEAWEISQGDPEIIVAVLDTGVDLEHPELKESLVEGWDFVHGSNVPQDDNGHGTHVAGVIAATIDNRIGIAGIAPKVKIMPVKVLDEKGEGSPYRIAEGIRYAAENGANIINLSLGSDERSTALRGAVDYAHAKGALVVAAAGNDGIGSVYYPAKYASVIAVSALDQRNKLADFSNYGSQIDVSAPGVAILNTCWHSDKGSGYGYLDGTSAATPIVSGVAALVWSKNRQFTNLEVREAILETATDLGDPGFDSKFGFGKINALEALKYKLPKTFQDIQGHWAQAELEKLATEGLLQGRDSEYFAPEDNVTRAEFATMLVRGLGLQEASISAEIYFNDVHTTDWFYPYIKTAVDAGIAKGKKIDSFAPGDNITREEMAAMLVRALNYRSVFVNLSSDEVAEILSAFQDEGEIQPWARGELAKAVYTGLIKGRTETAIVPSAHSKRAEAGVIIFRLLNL